MPAATASSVNDYLPKQEYLQHIPLPEDIVGFNLGERHVRHDQVMHYLTALSQQSDRALLTNIGKTNELRQQVLLTISSKENLLNLDAILKDRQFIQTADKSTSDTGPVVVWLGYSVHGDEISGTNAAMIIAYHLAASQNENVLKMLDEMIIVLEPSINPDGMDRFVNWVNTYRGVTDNADPNHMEHHQPWRTGRTNHFGFDLNRDWLLISQQETKNRLPYFYYYQPNVLGDFHEMGHNSSYFFQPGIPSRTNPLTPKENIRLTEMLAEFHATALDSANQLYYSQENFDDFYYGKGSTYPDINGAIGILYEQASSRGMQQETINGLLTFEQGVQNHVYTSLSTIEGAWKNQETLRKYRKNFYRQAKKLAKKEAFSGYLISEEKDKFRLEVFLEKLSQHQIDVYPLMDDFRVKDTIYRKEASYYIPLEQEQYHVIKALFTTDTDFPDNTFYDVSGWTMPLAMNIDFDQVARTWGLSIGEKPWSKSQKTVSPLNKGSYAYAFEWHHYLAPKMLNSLLNSGVKAKVATKTFSSNMPSKAGLQKKDFATGTIMIPAGIQTELNWQQTLDNVAKENGIEVSAISTGLTVEGIDLGSNSFRVVNPINVLMIGGEGISQYEAAEVLFYLDDQLGIPVSIVEKSRLARVDLSRYSHIILIDGNYNNLNAATFGKFSTWVKNGGVAIGQKRGALWLSEKGLLKANFVKQHQLDQMYDTESLGYKDKESLSARKRIAGAIFSSELDLGHPLAYGFNKEQLPLFRNNTYIMEKPKFPFATVAQYSKVPLMSGYTDRNLVNRIANSAAIVGHNMGRGRVIGTADTLAFRGYWHGSAKLWANSLFFSKAFSVSVPK